jgi:D-sedoheptulose 7-phosphate isomerase
MTPSERVKHYIDASIRAQREALASLTEPVARGGRLIVQRLLEGGRVMSCGSGGSAMNAQLFASKMLNQFDRERPELPAISLCSDSAILTSIADGYGYDEVFAKQLRALGHQGDLLLAVTVDGNSESVNAAVEAAHERRMTVIALSGGDGGRMAGLLGDEDIEIRVPPHHTARTHELHLLVIHCLCDLVDAQLLGEQLEGEPA